MAAVISDDLLNDPITLALAVVMDRIRSLPKEDRNDLFDLVEALASAETEEDVAAASNGMREILKQQTGGTRTIEQTPPSQELRTWMEFVGGRIRHFRESANLTQEELAQRAGLPQSHISRLETNRHSPSSLTLEKIARALGVSAAQLDPSA